MRRIRILLVPIISWSSMALAAGDIVLRTTAQPMEAWVGQRVVLQVDVLSDDGWAQISRFGDVDLSGAYMIRTESQGTRLQETIDGVAYTGQRYEVSVYPQKAGAIAVPPLPVEVTIKTWGADGSQAVQQKRTPAVTISATLPPGAEDIRGLISTTRFAAEQQWSAKTASPKVGDALKRTVIMQAEDVSAMAIVPLDYPDLPGVGIYPAEPSVNDSADRGSLTGKRTETVTYVFERAGTALIPDIVLTWWNLSAGKLETVTLPGHELNIIAGPAGASSANGMPAFERYDWRRWWLPAAVLLVLAYLLLRVRSTLVLHWRAWRKRQLESEAWYFRRALRSIRSADANLALRDIMRWLDRMNDADRPAQLRDFLRRHGDANALLAVDQLMRCVAADGRLVDSTALLHTLQKARKHWREAGQHKPNAPFDLPELNSGINRVRLGINRVRINRVRLD